MLTKKVAGNSGQLPPDMPGAGLTLVPAGVPANQSRFARGDSHARRMRRQGRASRASAPRRLGWSLGLW
jgi:hypothetical protein